MNPRLRFGLGIALLVVVLLAVGAVGFLGGHQLRKLADAPAASGGSTTPGQSSSPSASAPAVVGQATVPPPGPTSRAAGPTPDPAKVGAELQPLLRAAALGPKVGGYVADASTGTVLFDQTGSTGYIPASTTKLATASAILTVAKSTSRFTTFAVQGSVPGQVVLIGGGDPTLSAAPSGHASLYPNAARLAQLAAMIRKSFGSKVTSIVVDGSRYSGALEAPGWAAEDVPSDYQSSITALVVDGGLPATGGIIRSQNPDLEAGRALADLLGLPHTVPVRRGVAPADAKRLGSVQSAPMLDLVEQMLKDSDNVIAEMLGRQVAVAEHQPASFAGTVIAVRAVLAKLGVSSGVDLVDASGLSVEDRIAPSALAALLRVIVGGKHPALGGVVSAMPVAGWDGTLATRYQVKGSRAGAGEVRAKTGSLTGTNTLAGIVRDASGRLLVFAFMADKVGVYDELPADVALDAAAAALAGCGCR
ncbi:MAG: D-alanyl-D-alanine carboxypeptidase/D-alanyl-D-alanine endopeptidase [Jatrophihabitans sp.]